ncbi:hypothetical protein C8R43DRAFT_996025 [Mycena crocata]|nr:hypothetical protein C8R43DRAFT_996025 [Mycena crocata]
MPVFQLNTTEKCNATNHNSFPVFHTESGNSRSLQAYPNDRYFFQISMFALLASTNESVGIVLEKSRSIVERSFGIPINFDIALNEADSINNEQGILLYFTVSRSGAVISLVVVIMIANWLVTIAFLWITVAAFIWKAEIVTEMFVLPIGALFAFTSVRANLPGAPAVFGAVVDYYGILPNLALMTLFGAILLVGVLYRRIRSSKSSHEDEESPPTPQPEAQHHTALLQTVVELKTAVNGLEKVIAAMAQHSVSHREATSRQPISLTDTGNGPYT